MILTFKYRAYPSKSQRREIDRQLEICKKLYNDSLRYKIDKYEKENIKVSTFDLHVILTTWKKKDPDLQSVYSQVLQNVQERVGLAFEGFFRRLKSGDKSGFPKEKDRYRSLTYPQSGFNLLEKQTRLSKIGKIKTIFHRPLQGKIKNVSLVKYPTNKYYICIMVDVNTITEKSEYVNYVGIDLGCNHLAVMSDGKVIDNPHLFKKSKSKLSRLQTKNKNTSKLHEKISNQRKDFLHKVANKIIKEYDVICLENIDIKNIISKGFSKSFRRAVLDNGWGILIDMIKYKAVMAGKHVILVDPSHTSQICSKCGKIKKIELKERSYYCESCGLLIDRDLNASYNILRLGIQSFGENP